MFDDLDLTDFWEPSDYAQQTYVDASVTAAMVATVENKLGYKLPSAYVALMKHQNGGMPKRNRHRTAQRTSWAQDHIAITGISAIGTAKEWGPSWPTINAARLASTLLRVTSCEKGPAQQPRLFREVKGQ